MAEMLSQVVGDESAATLAATKLFLASDDSNRSLCGVGESFEYLSILSNRA